MTSDIDRLERAILLEGRFADRPTDPSVATWFLATDRRLIYHHDGDSWVPVAGIGTPDATAENHAVTNYFRTTRQGFQTPVTDGRLHSDNNEAISLPGTTASTIHDIDVTGVVKTLWFAIKSTSREDLYESYVEIYADSEETPDVTFSNGLASVLGWADEIGPEGAKVSLGNNHVHAEAGLGDLDDAYTLTYTLRYPIPVEEHLRVDYVRTGEGTINFHSNVIYEELPDRQVPNHRLRTASNLVGRDGFATAQPQSAYEYLNLDSGAGYVVGHNNLFANSNGNRIDVEADICCYYDGESTPSYRSGGTEDWHFGGWVFNRGQSFQQFGPTLVGLNAYNAPPYKLLAHTDLLDVHGGLRFTDGIRLELDTDEANDDIDLAYIIWYYDEK